MTNNSLEQAKRAKNDEFYTVYDYIQKEMNAYLEYNPDVFKDKTVLLPCDDPEWSNFTRYFAQNFELLGLKKLISTSYSLDWKKEIWAISWNDIIRIRCSLCDEEKSRTKGKIYTLARNGRKKIDINDLAWNYLNGDGDFRSDEVKALRDEADVIVTNPPISIIC